MPIDSGDADGLLYYVMPFVDGESLRDRMTRETPMLERATPLLAAVTVSSRGDRVGPA